MKRTFEPHDSAWSRIIIPPQDSLHSDLAVDVCIVGAGIAGMSAAYLLARENRSVAVLEDGLVGGGQTGNTTAHLSCVIDDRYTEIERIHGQSGARLAADSHRSAINAIESIATREHIACEFERVDGFLFNAPGQDLEELHKEMEAAERAGLTVRRIQSAPLSGFDTGSCLCFPGQGQFHPMKYLAGIVEAVKRRGGRIFTGVHVSDVQDGSPVRVLTEAGPTVTAGAVIVATNTPISNRFALHTKQAAYLSFVIGARIPRGSVHKALYWDMADPYHYVRLHCDPEEKDDLLIVGGEDRKTGQQDGTQDAERYDRLFKWARERFPMIERIEFRWAGQVMETVDGLAFIGRNPGDENVYVVTGDSGMGMTHGTIAGLLLTDLLAGRTNSWSKLYDPSRKPVSAAKDYLRENLNIAAQYAKWLAPAEVDSIDEIPAGTGALMRRGLSKVAIYRDERGVAHTMSAMCTHLGCAVSWNDKDKMWDCPCHGSRFDKFGNVVNGPANKPLAHIDLEKKAA